MEEVTPVEIEFLNEAGNLPEEYMEYFLPPLKDGRVVIPGKNGRVGDLEVRIFQPFIAVRIGDHTEARFSSVKDAVAFIRKVVTDRIVFHFSEDGMEYYNFDEFESLSEADQDYYVWSGPFRYVFLDRR
jgi:hypothetical protein